MQNLKAVAIGMLTAITIFWSNKPNTAIEYGLKDAFPEPPQFSQKGEILVRRGSPSGTETPFIFFGRFSSIPLPGRQAGKKAGKAGREKTGRTQGRKGTN
jgi:hypothetical protein